PEPLIRVGPARIGVDPRRCGPGRPTVRAVRQQHVRGVGGSRRAGAPQHVHPPLPRPAAPVHDNLGLPRKPSPVCIGPPPPPPPQPVWVGAVYVGPPVRGFGDNTIGESSPAMISCPAAPMASVPNRGGPGIVVGAANESPPSVDLLNVFGA